MALLSKPSSAARTALIYITIGALLTAWTAIFWWYLHNKPADEVPLRTWYICYGALATGIILFVIGLAVGQIGRSARHAELPPPEATPAEAKADQAAAQRPVAMPAAPVAATPPGSPVPAAPAVPGTPAVPTTAAVAQQAPRP